MKRFATCILVVLCLGVGAAHWADLLGGTDLATGFVTYGPYWVRYGVLAVAVALLGLAAFIATKRPAAFFKGSVAQGLSCILGGLAFAALGGARLGVFARLELFDRIGAVLYLLCALWLLMLGRSRFSPEFEPPTGSAIFGVLGTLAFYLLCIQRFCLEPTGIVRVGDTIQALAALAALLFGASQLKLAYLPGGKSGAWVMFTGMLAFLLCTCLSLPTVVCEYLNGFATLDLLLQEISLGCLGVAGLIYAFGAVGPEEAAP